MNDGCSSSVDSKRSITFASSVRPTSTSAFLFVKVFGRGGVARQMVLGTSIRSLGKGNCRGFRNCNGASTLGNRRRMVAFPDISGDDDDDGLGDDGEFVMVVVFVFASRLRGWNDLGGLGRMRMVVLLA